MSRKLRQASLSSLAGVVVLEDLERDNALLKDASADEYDKVRALRRLTSKRPCLDALCSTGIGRTIRKLATKEEASPEVKEAAKKVYRLWRGELERKDKLRQKSPVEVAWDSDTIEWRQKARDLLGAQFSQGDWPDRLEGELFESNHRLLNGAYRRCVRRMVFHLKQQSVRDRLLNKELSARSFVAENLSR